MISITRINEFLANAGRHPTKRATETTEIKNDSDLVYEIDYVTRCFRWLDQGHDVYDSHQGWVLVTCHETKKRFFHVINVPNKNQLECRGCGIEI